MIAVWSDERQAHSEAVIEEQGIGAWRENPEDSFGRLVLDARREARILTDDELVTFGRSARRSLEIDEGEREMPAWLVCWQRARVQAANDEWRYRYQKVKPTDNASFRDWIDRAKERVDMASLIALPYRSKPMGRGKWMVCCPIHDDSDASLSLDTDKRVFNCFGCGFKGDVLSWIQVVENRDWRDALDRLEELSGLRRPQRASREIRGVRIVKVNGTA